MTKLASNDIDVTPLQYAALYSIGSKGYSDIGSGLLIAEDSISLVSAELRALFNQFLVVSLLESFEPEACPYCLPQSIVDLYRRDLNRIARQLDELDEDFYHLCNDGLQKDLAILAHKLLPAGSEYIYPDSGVPRSLLFKGGLKQFYRGVVVCVFESGGFRPFLELHAHTLALEDFNPEGWIETYSRIADFLEANPKFKGVTSSSWFLDPALERISPHLSYLREVPQENGAIILFSEYDRDGNSGALEKSSTRRVLFGKGKYTPAIYTRIWPRKNIIKLRDNCLKSQDK